MLSTPKIFMFSGQGSQYFHMGKALYDEHPVFRKEIQSLDRLATRLLGQSILDVLYDTSQTKIDIFDRTLHSHPAIFMVEVALVETLAYEGIFPDYVMGASMGCFAAAVSAGCLSAEAGLISVVAQARLLERHCAWGTMLAVLDAPNLFSHYRELNENSCLAGINFDNHFVLSTDQKGLQEINRFFQRKQAILHQALAVSHGFHSHFIDEAKTPYLDFLCSQSIAKAKIPVICCMGKRLLTQLPTSYFWDVIRQPIYFQKTVTWLEERANPIYIDVGPSGTLATFVKYNLTQTSESSIHSIITTHGKDIEKIHQLVNTTQRSMI